MRILCGVDFSEASVGATRVAAAIARRRPDGELVLVHVLDPSHMMLDVYEQVRRGREARLKEIADELSTETEAHVRWSMRIGSPAHALAALAQDEHADLVVVSSLGHAQEALLRVGGVSERVVQVAPVPVLVVRESAPFEAWARGERPLRVLLGMDDSESAAAAADWVRWLRTVGPCDLVVGHIYYTDARQQYGLPPPRTVLDPYPELESLLARDLERMVGDLGGSGRVSFQPRIGLGRIGDHLLDLAIASQADMIVVGTHHAAGVSRLGSVSTVVLHFGHQSVACVPGPVEEPHAARDVPAIATIAAATDLSSWSSDAIAFACGVLAGRTGTLHLLHVADADSLETPRLEEVMRNLIPPRALVADGFKVVTHVLHEADPARAICEAAARIGADLVCVAPHGRSTPTRSRLTRLVFGSIAASVVRDCRCPVVVVHPRRP
jgi:nucleotide-binding universal stress UspA family protein